jgi:hypothetical protein
MNLKYGRIRLYFAAFYEAVFSGVRHSLRAAAPETQGAGSRMGVFPCASRSRVRSFSTAAAAVSRGTTAYGNRFANRKARA